MTLEAIKKHWKEVIIDYPQALNDFERESIEKLIAVAEAASSLLSELEAENNAPTHFNVYFILKEAIDALEREELER